MNLTTEQNFAISSLIEWYKSQSTQFITLGGYAGTGKTTLIAELAKTLKKINPKIRIAYCAYTGKASRVLQQKILSKNIINKKDTIGTIHSLIYSPITDTKGSIVGWEKKEKLNADLIIIDESSMLNQNIWTDLISFKTKIIAVGDHGQLPPISGTFNLMNNPQLTLSEIHRQAKENPIIDLSIKARKYGVIEPGEYSHKVKKIMRNDFDTNEILDGHFRSFNEDMLILCGSNFTRVRLNSYIRNLLDINSVNPEIYDRVICLRNNHKSQIFNGMLGTIKSISNEEDDFYLAQIEMDDEKDEYRGLIAKDQFNNPKTLNFSIDRNRIMKGDLFDFGYAITVHKAQGSQASKVVLFEERFQKMDDEQWRKWLYTGITRAEDSLLIVGK